MQPYNFPAITDTFENYLFSQYPDSIPDSSFKNIKDYYRFCYYWGSRLGVVNDSLSYDPYQIAAINNLADPYCSENDPAQWEILGPVTLPTQNLVLVSVVLDDPNVEDSYLISTEHGGLWKSQSTGNSWVNVTDNLRLPGISATEIIRNPFDSNHIIASTGGGRSGTSYGMGIIESFDNGETWSIMEGFPFQSAPKIVRVIVDPNDTDPNDGLTLYAIGLRKIYKSANTGIDWEEIGYPPTLKNYTQFADIEVNSCNQILVTTSANYNQIDGQVFIFYNNTWTEISDQFIDFETGKLSTPNNDKIFIVCDGSDRKIYKSINGGNDWTLIKEGLPAGFTDIEYSPYSNIVYHFGVSLHYFKDDGVYANLQVNTLHHDVRDIAFLGIDEYGYEELIVTNDGGVTSMRVNTNVCIPSAIYILI